MKGKTIHRREFLKYTTLSFVGSIAISLVACGKRDEDEAPAAETQTDQGKTGMISANHGHVAYVTSAQLGSNQSVVLNIKGSANHTHSLSLTAADLNNIKRGVRVTKYSSTQTDGHSHFVTFN